MKITLRKANAIQVAINDMIKSLEFKSTIDINEFQDPSKELTTASKNFGASINRRLELIDALYEIRKGVSNANSAERIDARLADIARFEKDITFFATYAKAQPRTELTIINGKLEKIRTRTEDAYSMRGTEVSTSIFTDSQIEDFRKIVASSKKVKQKLQDELLELNVRTEIELSEKTIKTLSDESIL